MPAVTSVLLVIFLPDLWPWPCAVSLCQIYFRDGGTIVEFSRIYSPISKDVCIWVYLNCRKNSKAPFSIIFHVLIESGKVMLLKSFWKNSTLCCFLYLNSLFTLMCYQNNLLIIICFFRETFVSLTTVEGVKQTLILMLNKCHVSFIIW